MLSDIDETDREIAARVQHAIRTEFQRVRDEVSAPPAVLPIADRRSRRRLLVPLVAACLALAVSAFALAARGNGGTGGEEVDRRVETVAGAEPVYFLPTGLAKEFVLENVYGPRAPEPAVSMPPSRVRSYREPGTDRFVVITTAVGVPASAPVPGWPGVSTVTIAGTTASLQVTPGSDDTWVTINLACGGVTAVGRYLDATKTVAALATLHCVDSAAAIDPPPPFELVLDDVTPPAWTRDQTTLGYRYFTSGGPKFVTLSFVEGTVDPNRAWLATTGASRIREVSRGARVYSLIESQAMVNGSPRMDHGYALSFNEDGSYVMLNTMGMTLDDTLTLADSVRRVGEPEFQAVLDALAVAWRKDVYAVADVVPDGYTVHTYEDRQRASINFSPPQPGHNYSMEFRSGPDFSANLPGREGQMVTAGDRTVRLVTFGMAVPPPNVGDPVTSEMTMRQVIWSENGVTVTLTTAGGPEVEPTLLAIIGGVRIVDEAEWRTFVERNKRG